MIPMAKDPMKEPKWMPTESVDKATVSCFSISFGGCLVSIILLFVALAVGVKLFKMIVA